MLDLAQMTLRYYRPDDNATQKSGNQHRIFHSSMLDYTFARTFAFAELREVNACVHANNSFSCPVPAGWSTSPMYSLPDQSVRPCIAIRSSACSLPDSEKVRMRP